MPSLNQLTLCGHLTRDPEVKYLQSGTAVCEFGLAVNDRVKKGEEWVDCPMFIDCSCFGKQAEFLGKHAQKGAAVLVTGKLRFEQWETDGQRRSKHKVSAERVQLLDKRPDSQERPETRQEYNQAPPPPTQDEIPF